MEWILFSCFALSFVFTFFVTPRWARKMKGIGLESSDMNRPKGSPKIAEPGGVIVMFGAIIGMLVYIYIRIFHFLSPLGIIEVFAMIVTVLLAGLIGFIDDVIKLLLRERKRAESLRYMKVLMTVPVAIPMAVVNAGHSVMIIPFIGAIDFGMLFPLLIVPIGIIGATNGFNMMSGHNGLEAGMGVIILSTLGLVAWLSGYGWVSMLSFIMAFSLLAFLWYNKPPASIFPGDSLTYAVGASIACVAILGNMERIAIILFIPYIFDALVFLKFAVHRRFDKSVVLPEAFATKVYPDGSLEYKERLCGFEPVGYYIARAFKKKVYERDWVVSILAVEMVLALVSFTLWFSGII